MNTAVSDYLSGIATTPDGGCVGDEILGVVERPDNDTLNLNALHVYFELGGVYERLDREAEYYQQNI